MDFYHLALDFHYTVFISYYTALDNTFKNNIQKMFGVCIYGNIYNMIDAKY